MYSHVSNKVSEDITSQQDDSISMVSSKCQFGYKKINYELSEWLMVGGISIVDEELGGLR